MASLPGSRRPDARGRARERRLLWIGIVSVLAAILAYELLQWPGLRVQRVEVTGLRQLTAEEVVREAGLRYQLPIWQVRPGEMVARLERDPRVEGANVQLLWPDGLRIAVVERQPVAAVAAQDGSSWWVDRYGVPFLKRPDHPGLPLIRLGRPAAVRPGRPLGPAAARPVALAALLAGARPPLTAVDVHADGSLTLWLQPAARPGAAPARRIPVWVGPEPAAREVAEELLGVLAEGAKRGLEPLYVDLRAPGRPAVAWPPREPPGSSGASGGG
ncbi:MAG: FtsQ-type POTRA domain-containing protein [Bacillota bacterium]|nr:FtsQ-type POTRA domain-containing protein [Bacillota bacterium]